MRLTVDPLLARKLLGDRLTRRELQVFCRVAIGLPMKEIAAAWRVGSGAISMAKFRMQDKLHLWSDADVVAARDREGNRDGG